MAAVTLPHPIGVATRPGRWQNTARGRQTTMPRWLRALAVAGGLLAPPLAGCAKETAFEPVAAFFPSGVQVQVDDAFSDGRRVYVATRITCGTIGPIYVDPDGMGLRLPDGRVLRRSALAGYDRSARARRREDEVFQGLRRGMVRALILSFDIPPDHPALAPATLIVGGVSFGTDPTPIVVGEVPLTAPRTLPEAPPRILE